MIVKFPGYIHPTKDSFYHAGKRYQTLEAMVRNLTEEERDKTTAWHIKRGLGAGRWAAALFKRQA
jgi:hypothetical protein